MGKKMIFSTREWSSMITESGTASLMRLFYFAYILFVFLLPNVELDVSVMWKSSL